MVELRDIDEPFSPNQFSLGRGGREALRTSPPAPHTSTPPRHSTHGTLAAAAGQREHHRRTLAQASSDALTCNAATAAAATDAAVTATTAAGLAPGPIGLACWMTGRCGMAPNWYDALELIFGRLKLRFAHSNTTTRLSALAQSRPHPPVRKKLPSQEFRTSPY